MPDGIVYSLGGTTPEEVREDTWGHLRPKPDIYHKGYVDCFNSQYQDYGILDVVFDGLEDSPWLYGVAMEFMEWVMAQKVLKDGEVKRIYFSFILTEDDTYTIKPDKTKPAKLATFK